MLSTNFWKKSVVVNQCFPLHITPSKLSRQQFEFSLKVKVMRSIQAISINLFYQRFLSCEFFVDIPHCTVCKMQHNLEGISCPERGFVPNVTVLRYFFFFQSLSTPCSNLTSQRDTTPFRTRTAFFLNAQILWRTQKNLLTWYGKVRNFHKQIFLFSFEPRTEQNYFLISALPYTKRSDQKIKSTN